MQKKELNWTVIRTFNRHEMIISEFLKKEGLTSFIPMQYVERQNTSDQKPRRVLAPVLHNYVFVELSMPMKQFSALLAKCATPLYILKIKRFQVLLIEVALKKKVACLLKGFIPDRRGAIAHLGSFLIAKGDHVGSQSVADTQHGVEHEVESIEESIGDFGNQDQHRQGIMRQI